MQESMLRQTLQVHVTSDTQKMQYTDAEMTNVMTRKFSPFVRNNASSDGLTNGLSIHQLCTDENLTQCHLTPIVSSGNSGRERIIVYLRRWHPGVHERSVVAPGLA